MKEGPSGSAIRYSRFETSGKARSRHAGRRSQAFETGWPANGRGSKDSVSSIALSVGYETESGLAPSSHTSRPNPRFNIENPLVIPHPSHRCWRISTCAGSCRDGRSSAGAKPRHAYLVRAYKAARPGQEPQVQPEIAAALREAGRVESTTVRSGRLAVPDGTSVARTLNESFVAEMQRLIECLEIFTGAVERGPVCPARDKTRFTSRGRC
jgi:hypothetical protein